MDIGAMRIRITFQRAVVQVDAFANHKNAWENYFTCWATGSQKKGSEKADTAGQEVIQKETVDFTCRCCSELKAVQKDSFRIIFGEEIYDITSINPNGWKGTSIKFRCELAQR